MSNTITRISNLVKRQTCESIKPVVVSIDPNAGSSTTVGPTNENSSEDLPVSFYDIILVTYNSISLYLLIMSLICLIGYY